MLVTGKSKVLGIFGDPVEHSLSPLMHNSAIEALGLDMVYVPWRVEPSMLDAALMGVRAMGIRGVNLTVPHKERALEHLDILSEEVEIIGAANTVVNDGGRLTGHNTDGRGLILSLDDGHGFSVKGKKVVIIGAGGAARGIAASMALEGAGEIVIANRTAKKAADLACEFNEKIKDASFFGISLDTDVLREAFTDSHLLVNASSAGLNGKNDLDLPLEALPGEAVVADIVYKPLLTKLLKCARELGLRTEDGLGMLAFQGGLALELWTGCQPPFDMMKRALREVVN